MSLLFYRLLNTRISSFWYFYLSNWFKTFRTSITQIILNTSTYHTFTNYWHETSILTVFWIGSWTLFFFSHYFTRKKIALPMRNSFYFHGIKLLYVFDKVAIFNRLKRLPRYFGQCFSFFFNYLFQKGFLRLNRPPPR